MAKITNKQLLAVFQILTKLDPGLDANNRTKSQFEFKAKVSYGLARNFKNLRAVVDDLEKVRVDTFKKYRTGEEETLNAEAAKKFNKDFSEVLEDTVDFPFHAININEFELDKNHVSTEVLGELLDLVITGEPS